MKIVFPLLVIFSNLGGARAADLPDFQGSWERNLEMTMNSAQQNPALQAPILDEIENNWGMPEFTYVFTRDRLTLRSNPEDLGNLGPYPFEIIESSQNFLKIDVDMKSNDVRFVLQLQYEGDCYSSYNASWDFKTYFCRSEAP